MGFSGSSNGFLELLVSNRNPASNDCLGRPMPKRLNNQALRQITNRHKSRSQEDDIVTRVGHKRMTGVTVSRSQEDDVEVTSRPQTL